MTECLSLLAVEARSRSDSKRGLGERVRSGEGERDACERGSASFWFRPHGGRLPQHDAATHLGAVLPVDLRHHAELARAPGKLLLRAGLLRLHHGNCLGGLPPRLWSGDLPPLYAAAVLQQANVRRAQLVTWAEARDSSENELGVKNPRQSFVQVSLNWGSPYWIVSL